jgi:hypothetical protein
MMLFSRHLTVDRILSVSAVLLTGYAILVMLNCRINPDEIEHLHSAWYIRNGYLPFVDFFQHHSPFFWYILALFPGLGTENPEVIIHARGLMTVVTILTAVIASFCAIRIGGGRTHGLLTYVIVMSVVFFLEKSINVRADGLGALLAVASFFFFLRIENGRLKNIIYTGLFAATAFLITQKALYFYAFYLSYFTIELFRKRIGWRSYAVFTLILASPAVISFAYAYSIGSLKEFLFCNYVLNAAKRGISGSFSYFIPTIKHNIFFWLTALSGVTYSIIKRKQNPKLLLSSLLGTTVFIAASLSSFYLQYFVPAVPFLAIASSCFIVEMAIRTGKWKHFLMLVIVFAYLCAPAIEFHRFKTNRSRGKIEMIGYFAKVTSREDCVYDEKRAFNIFRRDAHYLWYHHRLRKQYILMTGKYSSFSKCKVIRSKKPAVVDARPFKFDRCKEYPSYFESEYEGFYLRIDKRIPEN